MAQKKDANIGWVVGIIAAAGVIAFVVGLRVSHNISENSSTSNRERAPEAAPSVVVPPSDTSESKSHDQTQENLPPAYMVGQQFSIGYWNYICNRAYWTPILASSPYSIERANAKFVVVDLTIRNDDTSASTRPLLHLTDEKGRTYDESTAGMMSSGFFSVLETLNPGVSKRGNIAFDVPPDRQYFLIAAGGVESDKAAIVLLPMSSPPGQQSPDTSEKPKQTSAADDKPAPNTPPFLPNAVAKSLTAAPGAVVCADLQTVSIVFHLYAAHWEDSTADAMTKEQAGVVRGPAASAPDPKLYGCSLLVPGTPVRVENADAFTTGFPRVTAKLPDGTIIHGVTLPGMLSSGRSRTSQ